jgi:hypothetical protein
MCDVMLCELKTHHICIMGVGWARLLNPNLYLYLWELMASIYMGLQTCDIPYRLYLSTVVAICQDISVYSNCCMVGYIYLQQLL